MAWTWATRLERAESVHSGGGLATEEKRLTDELSVPLAAAPASSVESGKPEGWLLCKGRKTVGSGAPPPCSSEAVNSNKGSEQ